MANELHGRRVAILAADGVEQVELVQPRKALTDAGAQVHLLSLEAGEIQAMNHDIEPADTFPVDREVSSVSVRDYDALV
ncbi:MAG: DJ-1/PfpI family protein, partial [Geodermatophilaceae bacterium]|nr:DJ-1/PfpI family protein [Geodermatophilaceae bacterium]